MSNRDDNFRIIHEDLFYMRADFEKHVHSRAQFDASGKWSYAINVR